MYGYLYCENGGLERLPNDVGFVPNLNINVENMSFLYFWNLTCARRLGLHAHASWLYTQDDSCVRMPRASLALLFQKYIYLVIKSYIFHFNISQVNLISN